MKNRRIWHTEGYRRGLIGQRSLLSGIALALILPMTVQAQTPPSIAVYQPTGVQAGNVTIPYVISDSDSSSIGLLTEYSINTGGSWQAASVSGDTSGIVKTDYDSSLVWQSGTDLGDQDADSVWFRITPYDTSGWGTSDTTFVDIDNQAPQWIATESTSGDSTFTFWFSELVADSTATNTSNIALSGGLTAESIIGSDHDVWAIKSSIKTYRHGPAGGVIDSKLYVAGGFVPDTYFNTLEVYNPASDSWTTLTPMPTERWLAAAGVIDGKLYVAGGSDDTGRLSTLEVYNPATDTWTTKASMPSTTSDCATASVIDGKLYIADATTLEVYDPSTDSWTPKTPIPSARNRATAGVIDGKLYIAGGGFPTAVNLLEVYDPSTDSWADLESMPTARSSAAGGVINGQLYVAGGGDVGLVVYNPATNSWATKTSMPIINGMAVAGIIDGKLIIAGGGEATVQVYTALPSRFELTLSGGQSLSSADPPVTLTATSITDLNGNVVTSLDTTFTPADPNRPSIALYQPMGTQIGDVTVPYLISDPEGGPVGMLAEYSTNQGGTWLAASVSGDTSGITLADYDSSLVWQSGTDLADQEFSSVWFRITPHDPLGWGIADITFIDIDNLAPQWISAEGTSGDSTLTFWFNELVADTSATNTGNYSLTGGLSAGSISGIGHDVWSTKASISVARQAPEVGVIDGKLYMAGGIDGSSYLRTLEVYDPSTDSWTTKASPPTNRWVAQAGVIDGLFYVAGGGGDAGYSTALEVYNPSTDTWTTRASMPFGVSVGVAGVIDGKLYVASIEGTLMYNPSTDDWQTKTNKPGLRVGRAGGVIDGKLYIVADSDGSEEAILDIYDPSTDSWTTGTSAPTRRQRGTAGVIAGKLYVTGGDTQSGSAKTLEVYDPSTNEWTTETSIATVRTFPAAGVIDDELYIVAGSDELSVEVYTALPSQFELTLTSGQKLSSAEPPVTLTATNITDLNGNIATSLDTTFTPANLNRPGIAIWQPTGVQAGDVTVPYLISDPEGGPIGLLAEYSLDSGSNWLAAAVSIDTSDIARADFDSSLVWQSGTNLADQSVDGVWFRITPHDPLGWGVADITFIDIDNLAPQWVTAEGVTGDSTFTFGFDELVADSTATNTSNLSLSGGFTASSIIGSDDDEWLTLAAAPTGGHGAVSGVIDGKLYVAGGTSGNQLQVYDPATNSWVTLAPIPISTAWGVAGVIDNILYVAGGSGTNALQAYSPATNSWTILTPLLNSVDSGLAGVIEGRLYVVNGAGSGRLQIYDPANDSWTLRTSFTTIDHAASAGVIDGKLYIAGGATGGVALTTLEVYDPSADSWTVLPATMPTARTYSVAGVIEGKLYVAGGYDGVEEVDVLEVYDPVGGSWTTLGSMPNPRWMATAGVIDGRLYVALGGSGSPLEAYTAIPTRFEVTLADGETLTSDDVTVTVSNITDLLGNTISAPLDTTFTPDILDLARPAVSLTEPSAGQGNDVSIPFVITDSDASEVGLLVDYSTDSGTTWQAAAVSGDTSGIVVANYNANLTWQSAIDLAGQTATDTWLRITPYDRYGNGTADTITVDIDNLAPQSIGARAVAGSDSFEFWFDEPVVDARAMNTGNITITGLTIDTIEKVPNWIVEAPNLLWRHGPAAVTVGRKIYLIGGSGDDGIDTYNSLEIFDLDTGQWELRSGYPINLSYAWAVVIGNTIYAGGYGWPGFFYKYSIETDTWTALTADPDLGMSAVAVIDGLIYVAGGTGGSGKVGLLRIFNPTSETWSLGSSMMEPRSGAGYGVIDGKFYVAGGDGASGQMTSTEVYTPSTDTWEYASPLPSPEGSAAGWALGDKLYLAGGDTLWVYDSSIDTWSTAGRTPHDRVQHAITVFEGRAYTFGGFFASGDPTQVDSYDPINRYRAFLGSGDNMPFSSVNVSASNINDPYGNSAGILSVDFTPKDLNSDPTIILDSIDTEVSGDITIGYTLTDTEGDPIDLSPRYSLDGGSTWSVMTTDSDTSGITSENYTGSIIWQSGVDEPGLDKENVNVRVHAIDNVVETGNFDVVAFHVDNNDLPTVVLDGATIVGADTSWTVTYTLSDVESDTLTILAEYSLDGGATWSPAAVTGDTSGILPAGYSGSLKWMVGRDVASPTGSMIFRLTPLDHDAGTSDEVTVQAWNDNAPIVNLSTSAAGELSGDITFDYQLNDLDESTVALAIEYAGTGGGWSAATITGTTTGLTPAAGYEGSLTWDTATDLAGIDDPGMMLRVTPSDTEDGTPDTLVFHIDNNAVPGLSASSPAGTARDISLNFTLTDAENDTLRLWGYYSIDSRATWYLMTLVEDLSEILPGQYPSSATWQSFDDLGYASYDSIHVNLYAADHDTVGPQATDAITDFVNYVGDYSGDTSIDFTDFATLTSAWNDQNTYHDIGPATGTPPDLVPMPDGEIDFEDLAVFSIMWNSLADGQASLQTGEQGVGYVRSGSRTPSMEVEGHPVVVQPGEPDDVWQQDDGVVTWSIEAREIADLSAAYLVLQYDPTQLQFLDLEPGSFLGSMNGQDQSLIHLKRIDPQAGSLELMLGRIDRTDPDVDGSGVLAVARFREIVTAEHSITLGYDLKDRATATIAAGTYETMVSSTRLPGEFALLPNYPNPFNGQTTIRFQLPARQKVQLHLFNIRGQLVRTLLDEEMDPGYHKVTWDGRSEGGHTVASGIYIYLIQAGRNRQSLKLTIIK
ncbi:kelch repeat-containing protein [Gemmatimonadota bacterium]